MLLKVLLIFCLIFALKWQSVADARGRSSGRSRSSYSHRSSHKSSSSNVGWFSWFRGGSSNSNSGSAHSITSKKSVPPVLSHRNNVVQSPSHIGFAAYGNNYQANFHKSQSHQFQPMSHPYQSHFQPQTTGELERERK